MTTPPRPQRGLVIVDLVLIGAGVGLLFNFVPPVFHGDGAVRFQALEDLMSRGTLSTMRYSLIGPLFAAPLWLLGEVLQTPAWWVARFNLFLFTGALIGMWALLKDRVDDELIRKFLLIVIYASMFPAHVIDFYGEVFTALLVGTGLMAAVIQGRGLAWPLVVIGVANTPASVAGLALAALKRTFDTRRFRFLAVIVASAFLIVAETWLRRRELLVSDYSTDKGFPTVLPYSGLPGFSYPFFFGLLALLLSFGKGILFFAPGLLLPVRGVLKRLDDRLWTTYVLWLLFLVGLVVVYARWWAWYGGWFWGPRFLLFASIPASLALAVRVHRISARPLVNMLVIAALVLSVWVAVSGVVYGQANMDVCVQENYALEHLCWHIPEFSALWRPFVVAKPLLVRDVVFMGLAGVVLLRLILPMFPVLRSSFVAAGDRLQARYLRAGAWRI